MDSITENPINQTQPQNTEQPRNIKHRMYYLFILVVIIGSILTTGFFFFRQNSKGIQPLVSNPKSIPTTLPTPVPFRELTIPYLREQSYNSTLGKSELAYSGANFTAYVTSYSSVDLTIHGLLTKPSAEMPAGGWPAVVFIHGYIPPAQYETNGEAYSSYVDYLANNGFVVFKIDLRGHGNSEGEPGGGYYGSDCVTDTLNAYAALQSADFVNRKAIGLWAHSMAGNTILRSMAVRKDIPAAVIWAGAVYTYTDMQKYRISDASYQPLPNNTPGQRRRRELFEKHGSPSAQSEFWQQVAPTNYLADLKSAIAIHHAVDDAVVNIGYSRDLATLLDEASVPHELYEYPSGGHNITGGSFNTAMQRTVEFFKKYLNN